MTRYWVRGGELHEMNPCFDEMESGCVKVYTEADYLAIQSQLEERETHILEDHQTILRERQQLATLRAAAEECDRYAKEQYKHYEGTITSLTEELNDMRFKYGDIGERP